MSLTKEDWKKIFKKHKITAKKYGGDDEGSWAVFLNNVVKMTGLTRYEVDYYKQQVFKNFVEGK